MKIVFIVLLSTITYAQDNNMLYRRLLKLEQRVAKLEKQLSSQTSQHRGGLKVKDMQGSKIYSGQASQMPQLPPEQRKQIMQQLEQFKKSQKENQKVLDELMNEN